MGTLQYLTERIAKKLREQELLCRTLAVKIRYSDFSAQNRSCSLPCPSNDSRMLFRHVQALFEEMHLRRIRIRHVGVAASNIDPLHWQVTMFDQRSRQEALNSTLDIIRNKFGFMSILPAETIELKRKYRLQPNGYILHNPALTR
jgi:DNA polymerase-4